MILFYDKKDGGIFSTINGRVHDSTQLAIKISHGIPENQIGKIIIGWEESEETEDYEAETETLIEVSDNLFKKEKSKEIRQRKKLIEHNLDKFELLQKFEDNTPENPMDYKVDTKTNNLIKLTN